MRHSPASETYDLILDSAENLFGTRGVPNVTTAEVASFAGVKHEDLEAYFPHKDDLFLATCIRAIKDYSTAILRAVEACEGASGLATLRAIASPVAAFAIERPGFLLGLGDIGMSYPVDQSRPLFGDYRAALHECVAISVGTVIRGQADGSIRTDLTSDQITANTWGAFLGILKLQKPQSIPGSGIRSRQDMTGLIVALNVVLDSLRPPPEAR
jgi:AcrR family transcriptional regulator